MPGRWLNLELLDSSGMPLAGRRYTLTFDDGLEREGALDRLGKLSVEAPDGAMRAALVVAYRRVELVLSGLPDADTVEGAQERLNHLNFFVGAVDGDLGEYTAEGLRRFQREHGLDVTGELDPETVEVLQREHGS